jgi:predicted dehydrogenase
LRSHENVWWSFAPHDISVMLALFDEFPERAVQAQHSYVRPGICDFVYADYHFADGRSAHVEAGWLDTAKQARIDVFGDRGIISLTDSREGASLTLTPSEEQPGARNQIDLVKGIPQQITFGAHEPLRVELAAFCDAIVQGESMFSNGAHGIAVVRALAMAEEAAIDPFRLAALA